MLTFHLWQIDQVYSSPDGKAQFIELSDPADGENHLSGHFISSNEKTFAFPTDLPSTSTANHHFLVGTTSYAALPGAVTPDYVVPDNFFNPAGDTLDYADVDTFTFTSGQVPADGVNSVFRAANTHTLSTGPNSETNFAGQASSVSDVPKSGYLQLNLVSDQAGAALLQDAQLVNPWGVSQSATSPFWVSDNGTGVSTIYSGDVAGSPFSKSGLVVTVTGGSPTGQVANSTTDFSVSSGSASGAAKFIFASESGNITGWNPSVPAAGSTQAVVGASTANAVYKGIAMANNGTANQLYAANFNSGHIDVFSATFQPVTLAAGAFTDPNLPTGYAPFNIANIGGKLYVSYALQDAAKHDDVAGFGHGFVDVYDTSGALLQRLITGTPGDPNSPLNSPWGMTLAPANFGDLSGDLLVGNFGNGKINAFDPSTGAFKGTLTNATGAPIVIDGLWALQFGNGAGGGDANTLYFSAGTGGEQHGLFGALINASDTPLSGDGTKITTTEGTSFTGTVAAFASSITTATASAFTATVDWGDGTSSTGTVVANGDGGFNVTGSHTYTEEAATETMHVTISDGTNSVTLNASASVKDAALTATGVPVSLQQGTTLSNVAVATFTDAGGAEPDANYSATINWGDGTTTAGTVAGSGNTFTVTGSHTYAADGAHPISVNVKDEGGATATATTTATAGYLQVNLVSDQPGTALVTDPNLVNPWGVAFSPTSPFWVSDNGADVATIYSGDVNGSPFSKAGLVVSIPGGAPTGQVANTTSDFVVGSGSASGPAAFIFASENGSITGWNPKANPTQAQTAVTVPGAVYKGLALADNGTANELFATNFAAGTIDVFDASFHQVSLTAGAFTDPNLPAGFAPFDIELINGKLFVSYAKQDSAKHDDVAGFGNGFVDVYDTGGTLLQRLITGTPGDPTSPLDSPWGMALAPANFGDFSGDLLVGNFGNGKINAFDPNTGAFLGTLSNVSGEPLVIDGLWALAFGNGAAAGSTNTLFFTAGIGGEQHGLFGSLVNAENTPLTGDGAKLTATEGTGLSATVAAFASSNTAATASGFTATIDWGDGATSTGTVAANGDGGFNVTGSHTYTEEAATETMHVTVSDGTNSVTLNASASVKDAPLTAVGVPVSLQQGATLSNVAVATFTDAGGAEPDANYTATIDWGDGTTSTGTINGSGNTLTVTGSHTYTTNGQHAISTTIKDEGGATATATSSAQAGYLQVNLVSDQAGTALLTDPQLVNPWGISFSPTSPFWVSDNGADVATIYSGDVNGSAFGKAGLVVSIPGGAPTGQVANTTNDFVVHSGNASGPAKFIFASENGSITGWNPTTGATQAQVGVTVPGAVYKGLALANTGTANELFAANFAAGTIDVFDSSFHQVTLPTGAFTDPNLPAGFAPFDIELINGKLFVSYAKQDAAKHDDVAGFGNGFIDVYNIDGSMAQRLVTGKPGDPTSPLNSPWGMALAPANFGDFSGDLLVGNFGNGKINAFDPNTGAFLGTVADASGAPIVIDGLWALAFGNGAAAGSTNTLFFTAGIGGEQHGLFGSLVSAQNTPLAGDGAQLSTTEGVAVSGTIATFSTTNVGALPSAFSSTITWGDGATSAGTIVPNGSGGFNVLGSHTFAEEGTEAVSVAINDAADDNFTMNASIKVGDAPLAATGVTVTPAQGTTVSAATVATFTDAAGAEPVADFTATIDWGDGTSTTGAISLSGSTFSVAGSHTYAAAGAHTITTTIKDDGGSAATATSSTLMLTGQGTTISATEGTAFTGALATFTSNDTSLAASSFTATIDWGDGTSSTGSVSGSAGSFSVLGTHTYSEEANEAIQVTVAGNSSQSITIASSANVADAPLAAAGASLRVARNDSTKITLATFTDAGGPEAAANYTATIDWGDGSAITTGTISTSGSGFSVGGSHAYQKPGRHTVTVTISDEGGSTTSATSRVVVGSDHERLVQQFFEDLLHRDVDDGALNFFEGELNSGMSASAVVAQIEASTAFLANQVQTFFQQFLHRSAEAGAVSYFSNLMSTGSTPEHVEDIIISSPEYFQLHGGAGGNNFLNTLYQDGLGRGIDPQAQAFWNKLSLTDGSARAEVGAAVFASEEFLNDLVQQDFKTLLGRPADAASLAAFVKSLEGGVTDQQLLAAIMGSAEFAGNV
ncbi:MAG TPA: TIGR03118 family protein [Pirellulales bacterium]|nr:TIGR03118 family protein [Pirellulales bacterium]